jgi:hypothetical protein
VCKESTQNKEAFLTFSKPLEEETGVRTGLETGQREGSLETVGMQHEDDLQDISYMTTNKLNNTAASGRTTRPTRHPHPHPHAPVFPNPETNPHLQLHTIVTKAAFV